MVSLLLPPHPPPLAAVKPLCVVVKPFSNSLVPSMVATRDKSNCSIFGTDETYICPADAGFLGWQSGLL